MGNWPDDFTQSELTAARHIESKLRAAPEPSVEAVAREMEQDPDFFGRDPQWLRRLVRAVAAARERARKEEEG